MSTGSPFALSPDRTTSRFGFVFDGRRSWCRVWEYETQQGLVLILVQPRRPGPSVTNAIQDILVQYLRAHDYVKEDVAAVLEYREGHADGFGLRKLHIHTDTLPDWYSEDLLEAIGALKESREDEGDWSFLSDTEVHMLLFTGHPGH